MLILPSQLLRRPPIRFHGLEKVGQGHAAGHSGGFGWDIDNNGRCLMLIGFRGHDPILAYWARFGRFSAW